MNNDVKMGKSDPMEKREMFRIMAKSSRNTVIQLAKEVERNHEIVMVKKPAKTLVMLRMREPVANAEFFLGELLACEAMVRIGEKRGMALTAGDDFEKVAAMAVIDAAYNAGVPEIHWITERLKDMDEMIRKEEKKEIARHLKSKVEFRVMEGQ